MVPLGGDPFTIDVGIDGISGEVVLGVGVGLQGHHVDVGLQHHGAVFHPRRGRFLDDDVADGILLTARPSPWAHTHDQALSWASCLEGGGMEQICSKNCQINLGDRELSCATSGLLTSMENVSPHSAGQERDNDNTVNHAKM